MKASSQFIIQVSGNYRRLQIYQLPDRTFWGWCNSDLVYPFDAKLDADEAIAKLCVLYDATFIGIVQNEQSN